MYDNWYPSFGFPSTSHGCSPSCGACRTTSDTISTPLVLGKSEPMKIETLTIACYSAGHDFALIPESGSTKVFCRKCGETRSI